ncbi:AGAP004937PAlike, partial [Caligus rogercresseyi]
MFPNATTTLNNFGGYNSKIPEYSSNGSREGGGGGSSSPPNNKYNNGFSAPRGDYMSPVGPSSSNQRMLNNRFGYNNEEQPFDYSPRGFDRSISLQDHSHTMVSTFEIGTFNINGGGGGGDYNSSSNSHSNSSAASRMNNNAPPSGPGIRETGIIEKLL